MEKLKKNFRLTLEYAGTDFSGWQIQLDQRTVQGELEKAIQHLTGQAIRTIAAGRTDAGVHAKGQVACFIWDTQLEPWKIREAINALTPDDMSVRNVDTVPLQFNPRMHSAGKLYSYSLKNGRVPPTLDRHRIWHVKPNLNLEKMREAISYLEGEHDFHAFRAADCPAPHAVRCIHSAELVELDDGLLEISFFGTAFLKHMVRCMVGTILEIGKGRFEPEIVKTLFETKDHAQAGQTAPALGLILEAVYFDDRPPPPSLWSKVEEKYRKPRGGFEIN